MEDTQLIRICALIVLIYPPLALFYWFSVNLRKLFRGLRGKSDDDFQIHTRNNATAKPGAMFQMFVQKRKLRVGGVYPVVDGDNVVAMAECVADIGADESAVVDVLKVGADNNTERRNVGKGFYRFKILD